MSSSAEWSRFLTSLEKRGIRFDQVQLASNRQEVIRAAGITDALSIAVIETEWQRHVGSGATNVLADDTNTVTSSITGAFNSRLPTGRKSPSASSNNTLAPLLSTTVHPYEKGTPAVASVSGLPVLDSAAQLSKLPEELQDTVVAAEVLTAAVGLGGFFMQYNPAAPNTTSPSGSASGGFSVSPLVPSSMRHLCETVLPVADAFVALRCVETAEYESRSLVLMALGEVVSEINTSYAHQISKLQLWSEGRPMPLMGVVSEVLRVGHHLVRLRQVLPMDLIHTALANAAAPSRTSSSSGLIAPRILNHLCDQVKKFSGSREDHELLVLLLRRSLVPYLHMLHRWMHTGVLDDPYEEFFISEVYRPARPAPTAANHMQQRHIGQFFLDALVPSYTAGGYGSGVAPDALGGGSGSSGGPGGTSSSAAASQGRYGASRRAAAQQDVTAFDRRFSLNKSLIPAFLNSPTKIAKMIFFAGKYCCLLREYGATLPSFGSGAGGAEGNSFLTWNGADQLQRQVQESFEAASGAVIQLLFSPSIDLLGHLKSLKTYFLQERGDWVVDFLDSADSLLAEYPDRVKAHSMQVLLQAAIARSCASDPYHDLIGCTFAGCTLEELLQEQHRQRDSGRETVVLDQGIDVLPTRRSTGGGGQNNVNSGEVDAHRSVELLQLEADLQWPLTLVLDSKVIQRLNVIFRLLIWVKTCERRLCELWYTNEVLCEFSAAYGLKHQFVQFLRQFQFYAAHFVLEPLWSRLISRIGQTDSVFAISQALTDFFDGVETGLVLSSTQRFRSLAHILELTERFCEIGMHSSTATMPLIEATLHSVEDQYLRALSELASPVGPDYPQLVPLLTWIDFSRFYDQNNVYHVQHGTNSNGGSAAARGA
jgi:gamma-tubulin complex component 2